MLRRALDRLLRLLRSREVNYFYALDQFKARPAATAAMYYCWPARVLCLPAAAKEEVPATAVVH